MKRSKIKLEEITDVENCKRAIIHASKRKRRRSNVRHILANIDEYAEKLRAFLMDEKAEFSEGIYEIINEGTNKKRRELCKPIFFPDQCAHWAIMQIVFPVLEKSFDRYTCASIRGRGTHYAKRAVERFLKDTKNTKYCLQIDVKSFYASIDKGILTELLRRKIKDPRIVGLLAKVITAYKKRRLASWVVHLRTAREFLFDGARSVHKAQFTGQVYGAIYGRRRYVRKQQKAFTPRSGENCGIYRASASLSIKGELAGLQDALRQRQRQDNKATSDRFRRLQILPLQDDDPKKHFSTAHAPHAPLVERLQHTPSLCVYVLPRLFDEHGQRKRVGEVYRRENIRQNSQGDHKK